MRKAIMASLTLLLLPALAASAARADDAPAEGTFISVPNPITSEGYYRVVGTTERYLKRVKDAGAHREVKIIYDFNPANESASSRDFGPCRDLAKFIRKLQDVRTIAFVHKEATGHTVLPILACSDIVMSSEARLGNVRRYDDPQQGLESDVAAAYSDVIKERRCPAIVMKMLDKDLEVVRATKKGGGNWYIDKRRIDEEAKRGVIAVNREPVLGTGPASTLYTQQAGSAVRPRLVEQGESAGGGRGLRPGAGQSARRSVDGTRSDRLAHRRERRRHGRPRGVAQAPGRPRHRRQEQSG